MRAALQVVSVAVAASCAWLGPAPAYSSEGAGEASPPARAGRAGQRVVRRKPEPLHVQVARAVFPRERWHKIVQDSAQVLAQTIVEQGKGHYRLAPGFLDRLREQYERMLPYDEMLSDQASELGSHYNRVELARMLRFYTSPVGRKTVLTLPALMTVTMVQAQNRARERLPEALERLKEFVEVVPPDGHPDGTGEGPPSGDQDSGAPSLLEL
jgi:hypothetical protein